MPPPLTTLPDGERDAGLRRLAAIGTRLRALHEACPTAIPDAVDAMRALEPDASDSFAEAVRTARDLFVARASGRLAQPGSVPQEAP